MTKREWLELLPCPFCGTDAAVCCDDDRFYVRCNGLDCYCMLGEAYDGSAMPRHIFFDPDQAAEAWNRRATPSAPSNERQFT